MVKCNRVTNNTYTTSAMLRHVRSPPHSHNNSNLFTYNLSQFRERYLFNLCCYVKLHFGPFTFTWHSHRLFSSDGGAQYVFPYCFMHKTKLMIIIDNNISILASVNIIGIYIRLADMHHARCTRHHENACASCVCICLNYGKTHRIKFDNVPLSTWEPLVRLLLLLIIMMLHRNSEFS